MKVLIRLIGGAWLVTNEKGLPIAKVGAGWHFVTLCKLKNWQIINKDALNPEIANKLK